MLNKSFIKITFFSALLCALGPSAFAEETAAASEILSAPAIAAPKADAGNAFAQNFYLPNELRSQYKAVNVGGLVFIQTPDRSRRTQYSVVTDFGPGVVRSRYVPDLNSLEDIQKWVKAKMQTAEFHGATVRRLEVPTDDGHTKLLYWVGHKSFSNDVAAQTEIAAVENSAKNQGVDFQKMVAEADSAFVTAEDTVIETPQTKAQFKKEEEIALRFLDQLDIGNDLFGPFQGDPVGSRFDWQSFGESTFRRTNFESSNFNSQVGFWSNRFSFRGFRAPLNTIDPFIELTPALESNGVGFKQSMLIFTGLEYRPFANNPWLSNFAPFSLHLLEFVKSYRFFAQYGTRYNLKNDITGSHNHDFIYGVSIFYEHGVDLPPIADWNAPETVPDYLRLYTWLEYFGSYTYQMTNFSAEDDYESWLLNSSLTVGLKLPGIPLPPNPINEEFMVMPYLRLEHVDSNDFSFRFQNRWFFGAGARWMPFRTFKWKDTEWLYKTKIFVEYLGIGSAYNPKSNDHNVDPDWDFRVGINFSSRRY